MRLQFILSEVWTGLRRNLSIGISVVLVTAVSLFALGLGLLAQREVDTLKGYWYDRIQVTVFLCNEVSPDANCGGKAATDEQVEAVKTQLDDMKPLVKNVYFESEQDAYDNFQQQYRNSPIAENVREGDIPASYRVELSDPERYEVVASSFEGAPGVGRVQDQSETLSRLFSVINVVTAISAIMAAIMVTCAVLLIITTIRQAAFTRRRETGIMKLVGASNLTIRLPFVIETLVATLLGAAVAIGFLWAGLRWGVLDRMTKAFPDFPLIGYSDLTAIVPWLVGGILVVTILTSWATLWRYLRV